jgi:hypothetical protein
MYECDETTESKQQTRRKQPMSHYPPQEPQRQQPHDPYGSYHSYDPQQAQQTYVSQPSATPPSEQPYANYYPGSSQSKGESGSSGKRAGRIWHALVRFLGKRGLVVAAGAVLAVLAFFVLPYYSSYSGYFLAAQALDDKWWVELVLAVVPLIVVVGRQIVPSLKQRSWSLVITGSGVLGLLVNYWLMDGTISSNYWRLGTWSYFLGMALVAVGGLLLSIHNRKA